MGLRCILALGLGLAAVWPGTTFAVDHLVFGLSPGRTFDVYQNGQVIETGRASSGSGTVSFASSGGGSFQVVGTGGTIDVTPPAAVTTLAVTNTTTNSATLRWNTTGDDGNSGTASVFDVRFATFPITTGSWNSATQASAEPQPGPPGTQHTFTVNGLAQGTVYYFALKVGDEIPNWSSLSNVVSTTTQGSGDTIPPAQVTTLAVASTQANSVTLNWIAVGDDGASGRASLYDVRFSTSLITSGNWSQAQQFSGEPVPGNAGVLESFVGTGLSPGTTYFFAIRVADEASNWSPVSNSPSGQTQAGPPSNEFPLEGFGTDTPGGAGGSPYVVTSLGDSGSGTLRDAISSPNRTITFAVGGTIQLQSTLSVNTHHLTINGTNAPAPGITIAAAAGMSGDLVRMQSIDSHDIILRHLRFRDGPSDNLRIDGSGAHHIVFDHCSFRRPGDGNIDITNGAHDITIQWCILAIAAENSLVRTGVTNVTFHHNFFTGGTRKNPRVRDGANSTDLVNNLVYGWGADGVDFATSGSGNLVKNYFQAGLVSNIAEAVNIESSAGLVYTLDNQVPPQSDAAGTTASRFPAPPLNETSAAQARFDVLLDAGARPRDADDLSYVAQAGILGGGDGGGDTTPPAAVTDLRTDSPTQTTLRILWTASGDDGAVGRATQYDLRYSLSTITEANWANATRALGEPTPGQAGLPQLFTLGNLASGRKYYLALKVADEVLNWSLLSNVASGTTSQPDPEDTEAPAAVSDLAVIRTTQSTATITWTAPGDDDHDGQASVYDVRYSTSPINEFNWSQANQAPAEPAPRPAGNSEIMIIGGLGAATGYYFAIRSADEIPNWSGLSNVAIGETTEIPPDQTPPSAIEDLESVDERFDRVLLSWTETGDDGTSGTATSFELRMADSLITEANWIDAALVPGVPDPEGPFTHHELWVRDLAATHQYFFGVKTIDEVGNSSDLSNVLSVITPAVPDTIPPPTIVDLGGQPFSQTELDLEWTAPGDGPGQDIPVAVYEIRVQTVPLGSARRSAGDEPIVLTFSAADPVDPGQTETHRIDGLNSSTTYYCSIRSRDVAGNWSGSSNEVVITTFDDPPPPPPQGDEVPPAAITDLAPIELGMDFVVLAWTATGDDADEGMAERYEMRVSPDSLTSANWEDAALLETGSPKNAGEPESLRVENLTSGANYYFALRAYDLAENESELSNPAHVETQIVTDDVAPFSIVDLAVIDSTETSLTLRWTTPADTFPDGAEASAQVVEYALRYAPDTLDADGWDAATSAPAPEPRVPGEEVVWTVSDLQAGQTYAIALRSRDLAGNWSGLSNVLIAWTQVHEDDPPPPPPPDETAPGPVLEVSLTVIDSWSGRLIWTATGDDSTAGRATSYRVRRLAGTEEFPPDPSRENAWESAVVLAVPISPQEPGQTETMSVTGLSPGWLYTFGIVAVDDAGNPGPVVWSEIERTPFVLDEFPPDPVLDLTGEALTASVVRLDWTAPADLRTDELAGPVSGYILRRSPTPIDAESWESAPWESTWVAGVDPGELDFVEVAGLAADTTYYFGLRSTDPSGNVSVVSNSAEVTTPPDPDDPPDDDPEEDQTAPDRVTTLTGYALGPTALRLNWIAVGDDGSAGVAARTAIRWSRAPISESVWSGLDSLVSVPAPGLAGAVERFDWIGLEPATTYYLALRVYDEAGNASPLSNLVAVVLPEVQDTSPPAVPRNLRAFYDAIGVHLQWDPSPDPDLAGYDIHRARPGEPPQTLTDRVSGVEWLDATAEPGQHYTYLVSARDATGNISALSDGVEILIPDAAAVIVATVLERRADPVNQRDNRLVLHWDVKPGPDLKGFRVYREPVSESVQTDGTAPAGARPEEIQPGPEAVLMTSAIIKGPGPHEWTESPLPVPGTYRYWIEALGSGSRRVYLDPIEVGIPDWSHTVLALYPNPMVDRLTISFSLAATAATEVGIYGIDGRLLYRESLGTLPLGPQEWTWNGKQPDGQRLAAGTYFVALQAGNVVHRDRFVVMRRKG